ncbi:MAG: MFS transporter [Pseudomonadota bacterium]|nr:MFS transporter [Pseudomonadota bacterium]
MAHSASENNTPPLLAWSIYLLAGTFLAYEMALQVFPGIIATEMTASANISLSLIGWIAGIYFISYTTMQIPAGIAFDFISVRKVLVWACLTCALGVYLFSFFDYFLCMLIGRFLIGFGSSFAFTCVLVSASQYFDPRLYPLLVGGAQFLGGLGAWGGEAPLAYMVSSLGIDQSQRILWAIGLTLAILSYLIIPAEKKVINKDRLDKFKVDIKTTLSNEQTIANAAYAFFKWAPVIMIGGTWGVPFLEEALHIPAVHAAEAVGFIWISTAISSPFWGWLASKIGSCRIPMIIGAIIGFFASSFFVFYPHVYSSVLLFLIGAASASHLLTFVLVKHNNSSDIVGTALGFNNMAVVAGGILFNPLVGSILDHLVAGKIKPSIEDYQYALFIAPICYLIALFICTRYIRDAKPHAD